MLVDFLIFCKTDIELFGFKVALQKNIVVQSNNSYVEVNIITIKLVNIIIFYNKLFWWYLANISLKNPFLL